MALEEKLRTYEVLFRYRLDGTLRAHVQKILEFIKDGEVKSATPQAPIPLSMAGPDFDAIMDEINLAVLAERDSALIKLSDKNAECEALIAENETLIKTVDSA